MSNTNNMNRTVSVDEGVVLKLSTYNELYSKAKMLDAIVEDTLGTIALAPYKSEYTNIRVDVSGNLVLPAYIMNQVLDSFVSRLANQDPDYIRSLVDAGTHIFDFCTFRFEDFHNENNPLEFDLLKHPEFKRRWDEETKKIETERLNTETDEEEEYEMRT